MLTWDLHAGRRRGRPLWAAPIRAATVRERSSVRRSMGGRVAADRSASQRGGDDGQLALCPRLATPSRFFAVRSDWDSLAVGSVSLAVLVSVWRLWSIGQMYGFGLVALVSFRTEGVAGRISVTCCMCSATSIQACSPNEGYPLRSDGTLVLAIYCANRRPRRSRFVGCSPVRVMPVPASLGLGRYRRGIAWGGGGRICIQVWNASYPMKAVGTDGMFSVVFGGLELAGTRFVDQFENGVGAPCVALPGGGEGAAMRHLSQ